MIQTKNIKLFAESSEKAKDLYEAMTAYAENDMAERGYKGRNFSQVSKREMEDTITNLYLSEIESRTHIERNSQGDLEHFCADPVVVHMANVIRDFMIDMILPDTLMSGTLSYIADFRFKELGDTMSFDLESNGLFTVSKAGYRKKHNLIQQLEGTTVTLTPENHEITVGTDLFSILTNRNGSNIAKNVMKAVRSIETAMYFDAYDAFIKAMDTVAEPLAVTNYSENALINLCERVTAYNNGRKAVICGTPVALKSVLPSNTSYRYFLEDDYVKIGHIQTFNDYDVIPFHQVANPYDGKAYGLKLDDKKIFVISPDSDKLVKIGVGGSLISRTTAAENTANLTTLTTLNKAWDTQVITNSIAGVIKKLQ